MDEDEVRALPLLVPFMRAADALGISHTMAEDLIRSPQGFPVEVLRIGRLRKVRKVDLLRYLGIEP